MSTHYNFKVWDGVKLYTDTFPEGTFEDAAHITSHDGVVEERARRNTLENKSYLKWLETGERYKEHLRWLSACYDNNVETGSLTVIDLEQLKNSEANMTSPHDFSLGWYPPRMEGQWELESGYKEQS